MRTTIAIATFLLVGASAAGVRALNMVGSDTLKEITIDVTNLSAQDCGGVGNTPPGSITYIGTGSGNGQSALTGGTQQVAPMSRPLNSGAGICSSANNTKAEGIVHSLDGVAVPGNANSVGTCDGTSDPNCGKDSTHGLVNNLTITPDSPAVACTVDADCNSPTRAGVWGEHCDNPTSGTNAGTCKYTFKNWKHVLRILFGGQSVEVVPFDPVTFLLPECSGASDSCGLTEVPAGTTPCVADATSSTSFRCAGTASMNFRNCASPERKFLAANYNALFQSCSSTSCPNGIQHAFRRNDESGTTDVFVTLLSLPSIGQGTNVSPFCNVGTQGPKTSSSSVCTPFSGQTAADSNSGALPAPPAGNINLNPPTHIAVAAATYKGEYWTDMQDADVIRRTCAQPQEDVCEARGDLGLVLPIWDIPDTVAQGDAFPTKTCTQGVFFCSSATNENCLDGQTLTSGQTNTEAQCTGACAYPAVSYDYGDRTTGVPCTTSAQCNTGTATGGVCDTTSGRCSVVSCNTDNDCAGPVGSGTPAKTFPLPVPVGMCAADTNGVKSCGGALASRAVQDPRCVSTRAQPAPVGLGKMDSRVYNLTTWQQDTSSFGSFARVLAPRSTGLVPPCTAQKTVQNVPMVGAFYRIHSVHSFATQGSPATAALCKTNSSTEQIGCLVQASPCSTGYAGRESVTVAVNGVTNALALKSDGVDPNDQCIRNLIASSANPAVGSLYPLSRKLFLNTLIGFGSVTGDELKLAKCMAQRPIIDSSVTAHGFVTLSAATSGPGFVPPFCQDFDEHAVCATSSANVDACHDTPTNPSPVPDCENGQTAGSGCDHFGL